MEDRKINEMESLELISEMIRKTKNEGSMKEDYNTFLYYGYAAVIISIIVWAGIHFTGELEFSFIWFAMFVPYLWTTFAGKQKKPEVVT